MEKLQRKNARLNEELRKAHIIIDVQKKVAAPVGSSASRRRSGETFRSREMDVLLPLRDSRCVESLRHRLDGCHADASIVNPR
jgi:hypothetical protein